ncbi:MAG: hypothetical protein EXR67_04225 [Dehalococcoidia bacterium]|nr:hypothetical protein [Dehalococcoidia bacterium]
MTTSHADIIAKAIRDRKTLAITDEEGGRPNTRVFEPYILFASKNGNVILGGYQITGATYAGKPPVWHTIPVTKITSVSATKNRFLVREGFSSNDRTRYAEVVVAVTP